MRLDLLYFRRYTVEVGKLLGSDVTHVFQAFIFCNTLT